MVVAEDIKVALIQALIPLGLQYSDFNGGADASWVKSERRSCIIIGFFPNGRNQFRVQAASFIWGRMRP